ncbi:hypothetical protein ScPMuIL_000194 [Solemya velum]
MRYDYYQLTRKYQASFCQVYVSCQSALAMERNLSRQHPVPDGVIKNITDRIEPPDPHSNTWEAFSKTVESAKAFDRDTIKGIVDLIDAAILEPSSPVAEENIEEKNESRQGCSENVLHQADQIMRKLISQEMKDGTVSSCQMRSYANKLNKTKSELLEVLKRGYLISCEARALTTFTSSRVRVLLRDKKKEGTKQTFYI